MDFSIAALLAQDGITNGAIYALLALALVLVFTVTRVIFVPSGEFVTYGTLTLAGLQLGKPPGTVGLLVGLAVVAGAMETVAAARERDWRRHAAAARALSGRAAGDRRRSSTSLAPLSLPFPVADRAHARDRHGARAAALSVAYQPLAEASVLVLLIVSVAVHFAMIGLRPVVLRRRRLAHAGVLRRFVPRRRRQRQRAEPARRCCSRCC